MIVDLLTLTDQPLAFDFKIAPEEIDLQTEGVKVTGEADVRGELSKNAAKTDVSGAVKVPLEVDCTRCLTPVRTLLDIRFDVDFVGRDMVPEARETHLESTDLDVDVVEGNELDLTHLAREQILLNLPETILCREDCKGICPKCGSDLNAGNCNCSEDEIDPRWAALKDLKN
jgi:uncharacterized protein